MMMVTYSYPLSASPNVLKILTVTEVCYLAVFSWALYFRIRWYKQTWAKCNQMNDYSLTKVIKEVIMFDDC